MQARIGVEVKKSKMEYCESLVAVGSKAGDFVSKCGGSDLRGNRNARHRGRFYSLLFLWSFLGVMRLCDGSRSARESSARFQEKPENKTQKTTRRRVEEQILG